MGGGGAKDGAEAGVEGGEVAESCIEGDGRNRVGCRAQGKRRTTQAMGKHVRVRRHAGDLAEVA